MIDESIVKMFKLTFLEVLFSSVCYMRINVSKSGLINKEKARERESAELVKICKKKP